MELLDIGGRTVALGLFWQPRETKSIKVEARELASQMAGGADAREFDYVALRPQHQEYGLADSGGEGLSGKVLALAGVLADQVTGKWAGHYALETGRHWVVCIIDGQILADGDVVLEDLEAARALISQWQSNYSGLKAERHESTQEALAQLGQWVGKARGPVLVPLFGSGLTAGKTGRWAALTAAALALSAVVLWMFWPTPRQTETSVPPVAPAPISTVGRPGPAEAAVAATPSLPQPSVAPSSLGAACVQSYLEEPVSIGGWWTTGWICKAEGTLEVSWRRGPDGSFLQPPPGAHLDTADPDKASQSRPLALPPTVSVPVAERAQAAAGLYEVARVFGLQLNISWPSAPRVPTGVEVPGQPTSQPSFDSAAFHLKSPNESGVPEADLFAAMANVPGLALRLMAWEESAREWTYEGVLYTGRVQAR